MRLLVVVDEAKTADFLAKGLRESGFAGLGVALATGFSVRERILLPELFSDYRTAD